MINRKHRFQVYHTIEKNFLDLLYSTEKGNGLSIAFNSKGGFIIFDDDSSEWGNSDNCVLMEWTGREDCKKKRLFEDDLIQNGDSVMKIIWDEKDSCFGLVSVGGLRCSLIGVERLKKIGNFHQHPERFK